MIVNNITCKVGEFLTESNVNLSELSRNTGIPYKILYASVWDKNRSRNLRADEFMSICVALDANPMDFVEKANAKEIKQ